MSMKLINGEYVAEGPYTNTDYLRDISGVYIITGLTGLSHTVIDVGESQTVKSRVDYHDRASQWLSRGYSSLCVSVIYCNEQQRMQIEKELRAFYRPVCGER